MMPVIVIRPEPGNAATLSAASELGLDVRGFPLFEVRAREWECPSPEHFDGLLVGSANALRHGGRALEGLRGLPVHAVGELTAKAATDAGFTIASIGSIGLQSVLDGINPGTRLLRLSGEERIALSPPAGATIEERVVYATHALPLPQAAAALLRSGALVLLHSAEAARHFAAECDRLKLPRNAIRLALIGPRLIEAAGASWASVQIADAPGDAPLLALARRMCQERLP